MIDGLEEGIFETRMSITNILRALNEHPDDQELMDMQEWASTAYEANKTVLMLATDDEDIDWTEIEQLCLIKWRLTDIYNATHRLLQRTRYD